MNYLITNYFYPIKEKIQLSAHYNFILDNCRTNDEIDSLAIIIKESHEKNSTLRFPPIAENKYISLKYFLKEIESFYSANDNYLKEIFSHFKLNSINSVYHALASITIIIRFDDKNETEKIKNEIKLLRSKGESAIAILEEENPIISNANKLINYSQVLSLLTKKDNNFLRGSFVNSFDECFLKKNVKFADNLFYIAMNVKSSKKGIKKDNDDWLVFPLIKDKLIANSIKLDNFLLSQSSDRIEKLNYVGEVLGIVDKDVHDERIKIVLLTSILEMMITRNPDSTRFNIEDSINKQFQLKTTVIHYLANKRNSNLQTTKKEMQVLYSLRSMIAHGDYIELNKFIKKQKEKYFLEEYLQKLYSFIKSVLIEYVNDPEFLDFLKSS